MINQGKIQERLILGSIPILLILDRQRLCIICLFLIFLYFLRLFSERLPHLGVVSENQGDQRSKFTKSKFRCYIIKILGSGRGGEGVVAN